MKALWGILGGIVVLAAMAFGGAFGRIIGDTAVGALGTASRGSQMSEAQAATAEAMRDTLPKQLDEVTVWKGVSSDGPTLQYEYELAGVAADYSTTFKTDITDLVTGKVCGSSEMRLVMTHGGFYRYQYHDSTGAVMADFTVGTSNC